MRVRLLLVNEYFTPHAPGGAERSNRLLATALAAHGHEVVVATTGYGLAPATAESEHDRELAGLGVRVERMRLAAPPPGDDRVQPSYAFGNPLMIEMRYFFAEDEILQKRGAARIGPKRVLIVAERDALVRSKGGMLSTGDLVQFAAGSRLGASVGNCSFFVLAFSRITRRFPFVHDRSP